MKKIGLFSIVLAAATFVMVSCGGGETAPAETTEVAAAPVEAAPVEAAAPAFDIQKGKVVYDQLCTACHAVGVAGAAKLDDKARWEESAAKGLATLHTNAIKGFTGTYGVMPAKGGNPNFTDDDMKNAIAYMLNTAGVTAQ
jgi:cytochrome c5